MVLGFLALRAVTAWRSNGDTVVLIHDSDKVLDCLRSGIFHGCVIVHFPLFQFIPAVVLKARQASDTAILVFFAWMNWVAFAAAVGLTWQSLRRHASETVALAAVFVLLTSPFLPYTVETLNEPVAALLTLAFSVAVVTGARLRWVVPLLILTAITKETAPPFLLMIGLLRLLRRDQPQSAEGSYVGALGLATVVGIGINAGFNVFRYDSVFNLQLLDPALRVDTLAQGAINFAGIWLSPNGGLVPFWMSFALICLVMFRAGAATARESNAQAWPAGWLALMLLALTLGLSSWYSPHGWIAWGPRLLLPWLPSILYLTCYFYPRRIEHGVAFLGANPVRWCIATWVILAFALPSFFTSLDTRVLIALFQPDEVYSRSITIQEDRSGYFAYLDYLMWAKRSMLTASYDWLLQSSVRDKLLLYLVCVTILSEATAASARRSAK